MAAAEAGRRWNQEPGLSPGLTQMAGPRALAILLGSFQSPSRELDQSEAVGLEQMPLGIFWHHGDWLYVLLHNTGIKHTDLHELILLHRIFEIPKGKHHICGNQYTEYQKCNVPK